jgi:uncharacterized protein (TIGR02147 family)
MDRTELLSHSCYKALLREKQKAKVKATPNLTWKFIAGKVRVQHTYISRSFHREDVHLSEDHLYEVMELLQFDTFEKEYLLLLRAKALASSAARKAYVEQRLVTLVNEHIVKVDVRKKEASPEQTAFLMNPLMIVIYVALHAPHYANSPVRLERVLGITCDQLERHLKHLEELGMIRYDAVKKCVPQVNRSTMHFPKEHPLMSGHQQIMRHLSAARVARLEDHEKVNFTATFTASAGAFAKIREEFYKFLSEAQKIAGQDKDERVYQMAFDLFPWD